MIKNNKVLILAGGLGTRMEKYTAKIPKPMILVNGKPILTYIIKSYLNFGYNNFIISLGYKSDVFAKFFLKKKISLTKLKKGVTTQKILNKKKYNVTLVHTGTKTMTGGRIKGVEKFLDNDFFLCTYGDGISNVNINKLVKFHLKNKKLATVTTVRPRSRFGRLSIKKNFVVSFKEKPKMNDGWINGGFFVFEKKFLKLIKDKYSILEKSPLEKATKLKNLCAYKHNGFWHCIDTKKDRDSVALILKKNFK